MISRIVDYRTPEDIKRTCFNKVRHFLYDLKCDYPFFEEWLEHVFVMSYTKERSIITCESDDGLEIYGVCIIKKNEQENKICTLRVAKEMQRRGIGTRLIGTAITLLHDELPLITVPEKHLKPFVSLDLGYGFGVTQSISGEGGFMYSPAIGFQYKKFQFQVGYEHQSISGIEFGSCQIKAGVVF